MSTTQKLDHGHSVDAIALTYRNVSTLDPYFPGYATIFAVETNANKHPQLPPFVLQRREVVVASERPAVCLCGNLPRPQWRLGGVLDALHEPRRRPLGPGQPCAQRRVRHAAPVGEVALRARPAVSNEPLNSPRQVVSQRPCTRIGLGQASGVNVRPVGKSVSGCKWGSHGVNASHGSAVKHSGGSRKHARLGQVGGARW